MTSWQDFFDNLFLGWHWKQECEKERKARLACVNGKIELELALADAKEIIRQLELLVPHPNPPEVDLIAQKDSAWIQQVIDSLGLGIVRLPLDQTYYLTNQANFLNIVAWDWIDTVKYQKEVFDCENFAISFKAQVDYIFNLNQVGLVIDYESRHAYNIVIFPNGKVMLLEPQNDNLVLWSKRLTDFYSLRQAFVLI